MPKPAGCATETPATSTKTRPIKWQGQFKPDPAVEKRFARFDTAENGIRALGKLLLTYQRKHRLKMVKAIKSRWAPSVENDTDAYVSAVEANTGTQRGAEVDLTRPAVMAGFVKAIIHHENAGHAYPEAVLAEGVRRAAGAGMTPVQKLAGLVGLILVLMAGAAWQVQDLRMGEKLAKQGAAHQKALDAIASEAWRQQNAEQDKRLATEQRASAADQQHSLELSNEQRKQALLRDRLATADVRLSVLLDATDSASGCSVPATPSAVGVVHAACRAQLDPAHAQRIIAITDDGDQGLIALRACQAYVREVTP